MKVAAVVGGALAGAAALLVVGPPSASATPAEYAAHRLGPVASRSVYWVGHSLMNARDGRSSAKRHLIDTVGALAEARAQPYASFEQTLWGSPLSLAYGGATHGYERTDAAHAAKRAELTNHGERYDALVMTDTVPIAAAMKYEHSAYYATRFACDHLAKRPDARLYLFESWINLQGVSDERAFGSPAAWRFTERLADERRGYEKLADDVMSGAIREPGWKGRLTGWLRRPAPCTPSTPVFLIPVGTTLAALDTALRRERWDFEGRALAMTDFFSNPYLETPSGWPRDDLDTPSARALLATMPRRYADEPVDDIHPNVRGVYLAALVHYAVLYRQTPVGLPALDSGLEGDTLARLQQLVWRQVVDDVRTGVAPSGDR